jgi:hypothetical protein
MLEKDKNMMFIGTVSGLVWLITAFIIVGDMFKKNTAIGCLGLFLLPIFPFIWVLKWYSGKRKIMIPLLYGSFLIFILTFVTGWNNTSAELQPFIASAKRVTSIECSLNSIQFQNGESRIVLMAQVPKHFTIKDYDNIEEMVQLYKGKYIDPIAGAYPEIYKQTNQKVIIIAIPTPSGFTACYRIVSPGTVEKAWASTGDDI